jgi:AraC-like DNA-binding protein
MPSFLRSASLTNYVEVARSAGLDPHAVLRSAGISPAALLDPDIRLPAEPVMQMLEDSARLSGAEDFGLRMAETRQLGNLGPLAVALRKEPTLRGALASFSRHVRLQNEIMCVRVQESGQAAMLIVEVVDAGPGTFRQSVELVVAVLCRMLRSLLGEDWQPRNICFAHRRPASIATYKRIFGMPVNFGQDFNGFVLGSADLDAAMPSYDPALAHDARDFLDAKLAQSDANVPDLARRLVYTLLPAGECYADRVAQQMGMHRKTLYRHLAEHGQSYSSIVDEVRDELVMRYVRSGDRPLGDVAALLGFSSLSAFSRWFAGRYGCSLSKWRAGQGG